MSQSHVWTDDASVEGLAYRKKLIDLGERGLLGPPGAAFVLSNVNHNVPGVARRSAKDLPVGTIMIEVTHQRTCVCFTQPLRHVVGATQSSCDCDPDIQIVQPVPA